MATKYGGIMTVSLLYTRTCLGYSCLAAPVASSSSTTLRVGALAAWQRSFCFNNGMEEAPTCSVSCLKSSTAPSSCSRRIPMFIWFIKFLMIMNVWTLQACFFPRYIVQLPSATPITSIWFASALVAFMFVLVTSDFIMPAFLRAWNSSRLKATWGRLLPESTFA